MSGTTPIPPEDVDRVLAPFGTLASLLRNRDKVASGSAGKLTEHDLTVVPDRGICRQWTLVSGLPKDYKEVADEAAMLALHVDSAETPTPRWVVPGDSCTRADDPGWRWHCISGNGTTLAQWERRPLEGAISGLSVSGHTHAISAITGLQTELTVGGSGGIPLYTGSEASLSSATELTNDAMGHWVVCAGSSDYPVTLPPSPFAGCVVGVRISLSASAMVTIVGSAGSLLDGAEARAMWAGESAVLMWSGSEWRKIAGLTAPMRCAMRLASDQSVGAALTRVNITGIDVDTSPAMGDAANHCITVRRSGAYRVDGVLAVMSLSVNVARCLIYWTKTATPTTIRGQGEMCGLVGCYPHPQFTSICAFTAGDQVELRCYFSSAVTLDGDASNDSCFLSLTEIPSW